MADPPTETPPTPYGPESRSEDTVPRVVLDRISNRDFNEWYSERQFQTNILEGKAYFNGPSPPKDPEQHSPSKLLQCHRKASYSRKNAPREGTLPEGLFWIGSEFEEQVIVPFLQDITTPETYVTNSVWIDAEITVSGHELNVRGATDPAIVNGDADPLFVTEIKTTKSLDHLDEPKPNHKAQLHAYLYALHRDHDHDIRHGAIVYGSRTTLDIAVFPVTFDLTFWEDKVVPWMIDQTTYEQTDELPPAAPERDWECSYCSFKQRCGEGDAPYADVAYDGLLPLYTDYDRENLTDYLDAHAGREARLTPSLAYAYPDLANEYGAYDWSCISCEGTYGWDAVEWGGDVDNPPMCPACIETGSMVVLSGPEPEEQLSG